MRMKTEYVQYYVEGNDEKKLVDVLKNDLHLIRHGKVQTLNPVEREITRARLRTLHPGTMVVLIFDTDTGQAGILDKNLKILRACPFISEVVTIPQVANLESELVRSCNIRNITELLNSKTRGEFKNDILRVNNLGQKLMEHGFDIHRFWAAAPPAPYQNIANQADRIRLSP